jgi:hypothetical protein
MEQRFQDFENRLALLESGIITLENKKTNFLGKVNQQVVVHSFERHQFTRLMEHDALIWASFFVKITCGEVLMEELLFSKLNKNKEHLKLAWYSDKKDEAHVISMVAQMGLEMEVFVTLIDALIEERNWSAHFSLRECGCKMLDYRYLFRMFP